MADKRISARCGDLTLSGRHGIESEYGGGNGAEKRDAAFSRIMSMIQPLVAYLEERGFTLDVERVYDAIEAAWNKMNTEQIKAGTKNSEVTE